MSAVEALYVVFTVGFVVGSIIGFIIANLDMEP
jgi:uncharacterized membrane-anchored protein YhcB (DUF1043 family)